MTIFIRLKLLTLLLLTGMRYPIWSQTQPLYFEHLKVENGLSHNDVRCILQDHKGYLWFGTGQGLNKYDGNGFTAYNFDPRDSTSLANNMILGLWEEKEGDIWVGTTEATCKFDRSTERFTRFESDSRNPLAHAGAFNEDATGIRWVGNHTGELRQVDRKTGQFSSFNYASLFPANRHNPVLAAKGIQVLYKDKAGTLWIGSGNGLHQMHINPQGKGKPAQISFTSYQHDPNNANSLSHNDVLSILEDHVGVLWIGTQGGGLNAYDRKTGTFTRYRYDAQDSLSISSDRISRQALAEDQEGNLWIGTANGLNSFNKERTHFTRYFHNPKDPSSVSSNYIYSLMLDKSGILWLATIGGGVSKVDLHQKPFVLYRNDPDDPHSLSSDNISTIYEDKQGTVWISTVDGGVNILDKKTGKFTHYRHNPNDAYSLSSDRASAILEDRKGRLWIGNGEMLSRFDHQTATFIHYPLHHPFNPHNSVPPILTIHEDKEGLLWLGTTNGILSFNPSTFQIQHYPHDPNNPEGISDAWSHVIYEDRRGALWIGTGSHALNKLDRKTGKFTHYKYSSRNPVSITSNGVMSIYEDAQGNLWFGTTGGGLCQYDHLRETFTAFTKQQGLPDNNVYSILEDDQHNLWLGTGKGLSRFSVAEKTFTNYEWENISQSNAFAGECKGKDGTFYFGGRSGLILFHPGKIRANPYVPPVVITQFKVFGKAIPGQHEAKVIELNYDQNFFSFEFAALSFTSPYKNQYAYQLEGTDKEWVKAGTEHSASYTNISHGTYTFRVKGSNNDGVWNNTGTSIRIIIHPPFWRTMWFKTILVLLFGLLLIIIYKMRIRAIKAHNKQLEEMVRQRTEELNLRSYQLEKSLLETQRQQQEAEHQRQRAEEANRVKTELMNITVHDLKNPLGTIVLYTNLIKGALTDPPKVQSLTQIIQDTAQTMFQLLTNLLKKSKLESTAISLQKETVDLSLLVRAAVERNHVQAAQKQQQLILRQNGSYIVEADADLINDVLDNLISNAIKFTGKEKKIWIGAESTKAAVKVWVKDEGQGLQPEDWDRLFRPFQRLSALPTDGESSTGLGLSIVKRIIELHGGVIEATSEGPHQGSTFTVSIPAVHQEVTF